MPSHALARHLAKKMPCFRRPDRQPKNRRSATCSPSPSNLHQSQRPELYATDFVAGHELSNIPTDKHLQQTAGRD